MITLDMRLQKFSLDEILNAADRDSVTIIRADGKRLLLESEDAFAQEVAELGKSKRFMAFLESRKGEKGGTSVEALLQQLRDDE